MEENKYKAALERAKSAIKECGGNVGRIKMIESIFSDELWESEEEQHRKWIIEYLYDGLRKSDEQFKGQFKAAIAWLEKQGEPIDKGEISDGYHTFNELYYYRMLYNAAFFNMLPKEWVHKSKRHNDGEECFGGGWFIVMANLPTGQISNHYELKDWDLFQIPEKEVADKWDGHTPQEAADRLHKYLLEKQGEHTNFRNNIQIGDKVTRNKDGVLVNLSQLNRVAKKDEKQGKQKPIDKVEPRFHQGEWIVWQNKCYKVNYNGCGYELIDQNGLKTSLEYGTVDESAHLWSIADAKPGDVLACCDNKPFIFKGFFGLNFPNCLAAYCGVTLENQFGHCNGKTFWTNQDVKPATKEQCNLLFQKMHEAGYEWDADKKELKKTPNALEECEIERIEHGKYYYCIKDYYYAGKKEVSKGDVVQALKGMTIMALGVKANEYFIPVKSIVDNKPEDDRPAWSEEDENNLRDSIVIIDRYRMETQYADIKKVCKHCIDWLKSIKDRVQPQPKQDGKWKWEEDDEKFFKENILVGLGNADNVSEELYNKIIDWLNLIKKRLS